MGRDLEAMHLVVGSGPSGVACAAALIARGCDVTLLDAGHELEPERVALVKRLAAADPPDPRDVEALRRGAAPTLDGLPQKLAFGSDFPYRTDPALTPIELTGYEAAVSLARGGLSNVWGAAVLPFSALDIRDWPITAEDLAPHYAAVSDLIGATGIADDLRERLPLFGRPRPPLRSSLQARSLLSDLARHREALRQNGIVFGTARLAVAADECRYCGLCLHGCPRGVPYAAATTLSALQETGKLRYEGDILVDHIEESKGSVIVEGSRRASGERRSFRGARAYLGCGALSTARLLLRSMDLYDRAVPLHGSQYFLLPWLRYQGTPGVTSEPLHTLSQVFIEMDDPRISADAVHLQVYSYNDLYEGAMFSRVSRLRGLVASALAPLVERLLVIQGYLHSHESRPSEVRLERDSSGEHLRVHGVPDRGAERRVRAVVEKLGNLRELTRAVPIGPLLRLGRPGSGHHVGGTFPMRRGPGALESDVFGRPLGLRRVHLVDASTFPSVPSTTITLSIMANAHRIGAASEEELA